MPSLPQIWEVFAIISLNKLFSLLSFPSWTPVVCTLVLLGVFPKSLRLSVLSVVFFFFFFCSADLII